MSSSYDRGRRGGHNGNGDRYREYDNGRERNDSQDRKRPRDNSQSRYPPKGKFQKRGGGRGGGRGGKKQQHPEFRNVIETRPKDLSTKTVPFNDIGAKNDTKINLITNYFKVNAREGVAITQYRIDFKPPTEDRRLKFAIIKETRSDIGFYVYDGANIIYLMLKLSEKDVTKEVRLRDGTIFKVRFRESREIPYTDAMYFTILNLIIRACYEALGFNLIGRNYYDPMALKQVNDCKIDLWPGYKTSIRQHEDNLLLCCESTYKMMKTENIWTTIQEIGRNSRNHKVDAAKSIIGTTVVTTYNNKKYQIHDIEWIYLRDATFSWNGIEKTFIDYYRERYNIDGLDPNQPLLVSRAKAKDIRAGAPETFLLLPQLCQATGMNDRMRHDYRLMRNMAEHMRMTPDERIRKLTEFNRRLQNNQQCQRILNDNRLELSRELVTVDARRMVQEEIFFGNHKKVELGNIGSDAADWTSLLIKHEMYKCMSLPKGWVFICTKRSESIGLSFINKFIEVGRKLGMKISEEFKREILHNDKKNTYRDALFHHLKHDPKMLVIVVDNNDGERYAAIKKICSSSTNPVPIQILCAKTIADTNRGIMSIATKVAIQINCKLGGIPWYIRIPLKGLLVIGFDVTHDTNDRSKSYGAMVASLNPQEEGGQFFCCANSHKNGEQISNYLGANIIVALRKYQQLNKSLPQRIIIYRDGVGDGQIEYVNNYEVKDIESKVHRFYNYDPQNPENEPKIGFIIINKRINTRFFSQNMRDGRAGNPLPGTVVDSVVTLPERYDFYLISQNVKQGTVSPTSYNIIYDKMGLPPSRIQRLSYKFCHTYFNWSGTTRVPSVVQYAKKLALLIGQHLHLEPTNFKDDQMLYFL